MGGTAADDLIDELEGTLDSEERFRILEEAVMHTHEDQP